MVRELNPELCERSELDIATQWTAIQRRKRWESKRTTRLWLFGLGSGAFGTVLFFTLVIMKIPHSLVWVILELSSVGLFWWSLTKLWELWLGD